MPDKLVPRNNEAGMVLSVVEDDRIRVIMHFGIPAFLGCSEALLV
jgi:hypothetical protein